MERLSAVRLSPAGLKAGIFQPRLDDVFPAENPSALVHLLHSLARFERRRPLGREFNLNLHWSGDNTGLELAKRSMARWDFWRMSAQAAGWASSKQAVRLTPDFTSARSA